MAEAAEDANRHAAGVGVRAGRLLEQFRDGGPDRLCLEPVGGEVVQHRGGRRRHRPDGQHPGQGRRVRGPPHTHLPHPFAGQQPCRCDGGVERPGRSFAVSGTSRSAVSGRVGGVGSGNAGRVECGDRLGGRQQNNQSQRAVRECVRPKVDMKGSLPDRRSTCLTEKWRCRRPAAWAASQPSERDGFRPGRSSPQPPSHSPPPGGGRQV